MISSQCAEKIQERLQKGNLGAQALLVRRRQRPAGDGPPASIAGPPGADAETRVAQCRACPESWRLREITLKGKDEKRDIEAHRAQTDRMKAQIDAIEKLTLTPRQKAEMEHELMAESHSVGLQSLVDANRSGIEGQSQSAQQAHEIAMATAAAGAWRPICRLTRRHLRAGSQRKRQGRSSAGLPQGSC